MTAQGNKKKSPVIWFGLGFVAVVLATLIANWQSSLVRELHFPLNNGVAGLFTYSHFLAAVSQDDQIYIWNWSDLKDKPDVSAVKADQAVLVAPNTVLSARRAHTETIFVSELGNDKNYKSIAMNGASSHTWLGSNRDKSTVVAVTERGDDSNSEQVVYELRRVNWQNLRSEQITQITTNKTSRLLNVAVSDDGKYVLLTGQKAKTGWMVLVDIISNVVMWDKQAADFERFGIAVFLPDGKFIYARTSDSTLYKIDTGSGGIIDRWPASKTNGSVLGDTSVQDVGVSPDGRTVASIVASDLCMWDSRTGKQIFRRTPEHKIESGLAFSPDGRFVATSDMRQGGTIKIWRVPAH
ncbi:MAG: WD40 repeat domain-containing protein [Sedimentisphaerales bacterium]|jgi:WD40 repeat protein